eukprot:gene3611-4138_t
MGQGASRELFEKAVETVQNQAVPESSEIWTAMTSMPLEEEYIIPFIQSIREKQPDNLAIFIKKEYREERIQLLISNRQTIIPFVFDSESESSFGEKVFWLNRSPSLPKPDDKEISHDADSPLAVKLMESLLELLFMPGYTIDAALAGKEGSNPREEFPDALPITYSWIAGFGADTIQSTSVATAAMWQNQALLYSLINTFCTYDPIGWGIPYNHVMFADPVEGVAKLSVQLVNVLVSYDPPVHASPVSASSTPSPIESDFLSFVSNYGTSPQFLVSLLQYMEEGRKSQMTHGLVHIGTFILLVLSGERDFAISLNKNFSAHIVIDMPKPQGYADMVIMVLYRLIIDNNERLESIFECILTVLSNLSPYIKNLSMLTCVKLMKLFEYLSSPRFLFANPHNHRYVHLLLESFNNLLQHQYESNTRLLYAILRCQNQFSKLAYLKISPPPPPEEKKEDPQQQIADEAPKEPGQEPPALDSLEISAEGTGSHQNEPNKESQQKIPTTEHIEGPTNVPKEEPETKDEVHPTTTTTTTTTTSTTEQQPIHQEPPKPSFIPTDEWLQGIKATLPLENILKVITALSPQIQKLCTGSGSDENKIMEYLKISTTVGLFPSAGAVLTRRYHANPVTISWFIAYNWCVVYLSSDQFRQTNIKLFQVKH